MRVFNEKQRLNQLWLIILITLSSIIPIAIITVEYAKKENKNMADNIELLAIVFFIILVSSFLFMFQLKTRIDETGIHYQFFPFQFSFRVKHWKEIDKAYVRKYNALREYGGWGIKGHIKKVGKAYNVSGNIGLQLELKNGEKLLIGTRKEEEMKEIIKNYQHKISTNHE